MLDKQMLRTKERHVGHMSFLPQEVVWRDIWTKGLQRRHSYRQRSPQRELQLTTHLNERMQYTSLLQYVVQSQRDQDGAKTFVVPDQL